MAINGVVVGGMGTFQIGFVPPANFVPLQSGPTISVDDTSVTLGPIQPDMTFTANVAATDTNTQFTVTVAGVNGAGTALTHPFVIPILPQPAQQVTDFSLSQVS
jgi:hypothetical protein